MQNKKTLLLFIVLSILSLAPFTCAGQDVPESRLTVGVEFGRGLLLDCLVCDASNIVNLPLQNSDPESYQVLGSHLNYRVNRGFGLTSNFSYGNLQAQSTRFLIDNQGGEGFPIQRNVSVRSFMLTVGPQLFLRIGQGDLGVELRAGLNMQNARLKANGFGGEEFDFKYKIRFKRCGALRLSYTYWPTDWFGVQFLTEFFVGNTTFSDRYEPRIPYSESHPELDQQVIQAIGPQDDGVNTLNFGLGFTYRFSGKSGKFL